MALCSLIPTCPKTLFSFVYHHFNPFLRKSCIQITWNAGDTRQKALLRTQTRYQPRPVTRCFYVTFHVKPQSKSSLKLPIYLDQDINAQHPVTLRLICNRERLSNKFLVKIRLPALFSRLGELFIGDCKVHYPIIQTNKYFITI